MRRFDEGGLRFEFDGDEAGKYDEWRFYQRRFKDSCNGNKAVDFVYVEADRTWLIEVKDYRQHLRTKPGDLADEVAIKVRDTLAGLAAAKLNADDQDERRLARHALQKSKLRVVLHLEQPANPSKLFLRIVDPSKLKQKLKQKLKAIDPHPCVVDRNSLRPEMNWTVESIGT